MSTDRLSIRFFEDRDRELELAIHSDDRLFSHLPIDPRTPTEIDELLDKRVGQHSLDDVGATVSLAVEVATDKSYVGAVSLTPIQTDPLQVEIGYVALKTQQGHGYMSEAVAAVIDILFSGTQTHRIVAVIIVGNDSSVRLAERLGFRKEAHFVQSLYLRDEWRDESVYALLSEDRES
jgi:RimJ/RimL family protein N-acetyltransferase